MRIVEFENVLFEFDTKDVVSLQAEYCSPSVDLISIFARVTEQDVRVFNKFLNDWRPDFD